MTVDEILATGRYTDKRGREWHHSAFLPRWVTSSGFNYFGPVYAFVYEAEMRLLIERDMHRDECPGMNECRRHPQHHVLLDWEDTGKFLVYEPNRLFFRRIFDTHAEAMDAAYKLAVSND